MFLPQGTQIKMHETEPMPGLIGLVVGRSTSDQPIIGPGYIIEPVHHDTFYRPFISDDYPYTHFVAFQCQFDLI